MKIIRDEAPSNLYNKIMANAYQECRKENFIYTYDNSHNKHGKKDQVPMDQPTPTHHQRHIED